MNIDAMLRQLRIDSLCPNCRADAVDGECDHDKEQMTVICCACNYRQTVSYIAARRAGFDPTGGVYDTKVTVLNDEGEIASEFNIQIPRAPRKRESM
jgi:hypothetical protein